METYVFRIILLHVQTLRKTKHGFPGALRGGLNLLDAVLRGMPVSREFLAGAGLTMAWTRVRV